MRARCTLWQCVDIQTSKATSRDIQLYQRKETEEMREYRYVSLKDHRQGKASSGPVKVSRTATAVVKDRA